MRIATLLCLLSLSTLLVQAQPARETSTSQSPLEGTNWRLVSLGPVDEQQNIVPGTRPTLIFEAHGLATGSTGCNPFHGSYIVRGDTVSFGIVSTRRACMIEQATAQEKLYLNALEKARSFRLTANRLTIEYISRNNVLTFVSGPPQPPGGPQSTESDPITALTSYYSAVNNRNFEQAYRYWETPASKYNSFVRGFANTRNTRLLIEPPVHVEGAAGSLYAEIPVLLITEMRNGNEYFYAGCYTMRRTNQPGGGWRIYRANISQGSMASALRLAISNTCLSSP